MSSEHTEQPEHGKAAYDDINVRSVTVVSVVGAVLVFVSVVAVQVIYFRYNRAEQLRKVENVPVTLANEELARQRERILQAGEGADPERGERSIPIAEAMQLVLEDYRQRQENASGMNGEQAAVSE
jgi:hypothetical protein